MNHIEETFRVNTLARRERHLRVFAKSGMSRVRAKAILSFLTKPFSALWNSNTLAPVVKVFSFLSNIRTLAPHSPQKKLMFQTYCLAATCLVMSSFSVAGAFVPADLSYNDDYIQSYSVPGDILVSDDSGYLVKLSPQTETASRIGMNDYAVHTVSSGETLSAIASLYGIKLETLMWENGLGNANTLRTGQSLLIPPVDGVGYKVKSGDSLDKIASKYKVSVDAITAQNGIENGVIQKGQLLFLPGAKPITAPTSIASGYRNTSTYTNTRINADPSSAVPAAGKSFIYPTRGNVSQGFRGGHYALDIADRSKPPIWAAGEGTVEKVSTGTWGGGYGNHVVINHGDGVKTLYAHMDTVGVSVGDTVSQGDVLGIMGNTGRVYGATGIHLHWEVIVNGVRQNPYNYF